MPALALDIARAARYHRRLYNFAILLYNRIHAIDQGGGTVIPFLNHVLYRRSVQRSHRRIEAWPTTLYYLVTHLTFALTA